MTASLGPLHRAAASLAAVVALCAAPASVRADDKRTPGPAGADAFPLPITDTMRHAYFLADLLEYHGADNGPAAEWDLLSWIGGDYNRVWIKSEGGQLKPFRKGGDGDLQVLYGRLVSPFFDVQAGLRWELGWARASQKGRLQGVVGIQGLVPYEFDLEAALFVSTAADVSARLTTTKDFLLTEHAILQGRLETGVAAQRVSAFGVGTGLNDLSLGLRLRYEFVREFAPYVGVEWRRLFFGTAELARAEGLDPKLLTWVAGLRAWY